MTSPDGINWTARTVPNSSFGTPQLYGVAFGGNKFVAVGVSTAIQSTDGFTWTMSASTTANQTPGIWLSLAYGNNTFVATARTGSSQVMTSTDGDRWTTRTTPSGSWENVTFGDGKFVSGNSTVGALGTSSLMTSTDGVTWTSPTVADNPSIFRVIYVNGLFLALRNANGLISSTNGTDWTKREVTGAFVQSVAFGAGLYVGVAASGTNRVVTTKDPLEAAPPPTTTTTTPTTLPPTTTTIPKKPLRIPFVFGPNARRIAAYLGVPVPDGAKVRTKVTARSASVCRTSFNGNLLKIKKGTCTIFLTVTPTTGRPFIIRPSLTVD